MINNDALVNVILKMDAFMLKKGRDLQLKREIVDGINMFIGDNKLETVYINTNDRVNIPDVFVAPVYTADFGKFAMNPDITDCCPYGYTVEIHQRCLTKYKSEELVAIIIHHILQNVQSSVVKSRFMGAYAEATRAFRDADIIEAFDDVSHSETLYIAYLDICLRPLNVQASNNSAVGTDDVLRNLGLADAFDSALPKLVDPDTKYMPSDDRIAYELRRDTKTIKTILNACLNNGMKRYFTVVNEGLPMMTLQNVLHADKAGTVLGFVAKPIKHPVQSPEERKIAMTEAAILESFLNPRDEIELRYQIDKIITDLRFMEHADERSALLFRTRTLTIKIAKTREHVAKKLEKNPGNKDLMYKIEYLDSMISELDMIRDKIVKTEIKPHQVGLVVKYPTGYTY